MVQKWRLAAGLERKPGSSALDVHCEILVVDGSATFGLLPDVGATPESGKPHQLSADRAFVSFELRGQDGDPF